ncbi:hypothetical protein AAHE18_19G031000 [Arachis hypogaea]|uniref:Knottin scorpion toxin-like domain-containing protein n=1 Tax=Arachis hypogaea TaxID=3818 RepID=A0A6B9V342_ARAHY|nr:uncharacterized protein DS421_19g638410 [Arachis hypogaea]
MTKLTSANMFLLVLLVSVVWMTSEVGGERCQVVWYDAGCDEGIYDYSCVQECKRQYGFWAFGYCKVSLCECNYSCTSY